MYFMIDVGETIFFGIGLIFMIGLGIWYLCLNLGDYMDDKRCAKNIKIKSKNREKNREKAIEIIDKFEDLLSINDIKIPNADREENEDEACIYGSDYYNLEKAIIEILSK